METVKELIQILEKTPEMALWGLGIYFGFILIKLASWILALKVVIQQFIKRLFDYKERQLVNDKANEILKYFEDHSLSSVNSSLLIKLLETIKTSNSHYISARDLQQAINKLKK